MRQGQKSDFGMGGNTHQKQGNEKAYAALPFEKFGYKARQKTGQ